MQPRFRSPISIALLAAGLAMLDGPSWVVAHPGQRLDVRITIDLESVTLQVVVSADMLSCLLQEAEQNLDAPRDEGGRYSFPQVESEQRARDAIRTLFEDRYPLEVNGRPVACPLDSFEFVRPQDWSPENLLPPDLRLMMKHAMTETPRRVALIWTIFPYDPSRLSFGLAPTEEVVAQLRTPHEDRIIVFTEKEPEFIWHAPSDGLRRHAEDSVAVVKQPMLSLPLLSLGIVILWIAVAGGLRRTAIRPRARRWVLLLTSPALGVAVLAHGVWRIPVAAPGTSAIRPPPADEAISIFKSLHRNVYEAFDLREEGEVYDVLARSVDGRLLDEVYNEVYQSLILRDQGGAVARIKGVEILEAAMDSSGRLEFAPQAAFNVGSRWRVHGVVYHWGHVHSRTNEYRAVFTVGQRDGNWRITAISGMEQQRIPMPGDDPEFAQAEVPGGEP